MRLSAPPLTVEDPESDLASDWLLAPIAAVLEIPGRVWIVAALLFVGVTGLLGWELARSNSDLGGLARPEFTDLALTDNYKRLTQVSSGQSWSIAYEPRPRTTFVGIVRHVEHWRDAALPFVTHDVLVTTGDYADSRQVNTNVFDHHFTWWADAQPTGTINLLHILPLDEAIYDELLDLASWQEVRIAGPEILRIDYLNADGHATGAYWQDAGCNTILVTDVEILTR